MTTLMSVSARLYAAVLPLYPPELRRDFGPEMVEAFAEDLAEALQNRGLTGGIRVWYGALSELLRIALPSQMQKPAVAVPCIIFALSETVMSGELMLAFSQKSAALAHGPMPLDMIPVLVLWPSSLAALTAVVAQWAGNRSLPAQLKVSSD
jgi:hypothetical protein